MWWLLVSALAVIALVWWYGSAMSALSANRTPRRLQGSAARGEGFLDYFSASVNVPDGVAPEIASVNQPLPLADFLTPQTGLTSFSAGGCAVADTARSLELGGQYVQRTNNYRRDYPDNCSAPMSEFVGSVYAPKDSAIGATVPCAGAC